MALKYCLFILFQMFQRAIVLGFLIKRLHRGDCRKIMRSVEPCQWMQNSVCVCVCVCLCLIPFCPLLALVTARPRILLKRTGAETTILLSLLLPVCQSVCPSGPRFLLPFAHLHTSVRVLAFDPSVHPSAYLATQISSFSADSRFLGLGIW